MTFALIANTGAGGPPDGVTTSAINTTGANLIVVNAGWYVGVTANGTLSDSKSNTWTALTAATDGITSSRLFYSASPTVGSGHTFTYSGSSIYPAIAVTAWSGAAATPFDQENGHANGGVTPTTTISSGSVTPSEDNELLIAGISCGGPFIPASIDSGFTGADQVALSGGSNEGSGQAYLIQTTATAENPQWTGLSDLYVNAVIATFKAAAAGGGGGKPWLHYATQMGS